MGTLSKARQAEIAAERAKVRADMRDTLANVDTIYTVLTHVSTSGMLRVIRPIIGVINDAGKPVPWDITWMVVRAGIAKRHQRHEGVVLGGCGMDMGFQLVYAIGRFMIDGEPWACRGDRCPSNDHVNAPRMATGPDVVHTGDGGYRFRQSWL